MSESVLLERPEDISQTGTFIREDPRKPKVKCLIAGSRTINDYYLLTDFIMKTGEKFDAVLCGYATGVDRLGLRYAQELGLQVIPYIPNWAKHGKKAGILRNEQMVKDCDVAIILWDGTSPGTKSTLELLKKYERPYHLKRV